MFETRLLSSLSKVFADEDLQDVPVKTGSCLRGEVYSLQMAYRSQELVKGIEVDIETALEGLRDQDAIKKNYKTGDLECQAGVGTIEDAVLARIATAVTAVATATMAIAMAETRSLSGHRYGSSLKATPSASSFAISAERDSIC